jgi:hypothetical protein
MAADFYQADLYPVETTSAATDPIAIANAREPYGSAVVLDFSTTPASAVASNGTVGGP